LGVRQMAWDGQGGIKEKRKAGSAARRGDSGKDGRKG